MATCLSHRSRNAVAPGMLQTLDGWVGMPLAFSVDTGLNHAALLSYDKGLFCCLYQVLT